MKSEEPLKNTWGLFWLRHAPNVENVLWITFRHFVHCFYFKMGDISKCPPLSRASVQEAHKRIKSYIHQTPVATCHTINDLASTPQSERCPSTGPNVASEPAPHGRAQQRDASSYNARPKIRLFFKCESQQKIGAFKARGAFHALGRLIEEKGIEEVRRTGVCTHSSGTSLQMST